MKSLIIVGAILVCSLSMSACKSTCPAYAKEDAKPAMQSEQHIEAEKV